MGTNDADVLPVRGLHVLAHGSGDMDLRERFVREALPAEGVNALVVEINYGYRYESHPQVAGKGALSRTDLERLAGACRDAGVEFVPMINCLGHQSWGGRSGGLLKAFPEFDETPSIPQDADQRTIYCRSYCPNHPDVHHVVFALIDELLAVCEPAAFHVGMDEVFLISTTECPRCKGTDPAEVFAAEVTCLHDHLAAKGAAMWMWGDRFINPDDYATGTWEGSGNGTWPAVDDVPTDIVICDWHYEKAFETPAFFVEKGFPVLASPWRKQDVALDELAMMRRLRKETDLARGMLMTTWCDFDRFLEAYYGRLDEGEKRSASAIEAAACVKAVCAAMGGERARPPTA